jgi:RNA polymerase sigma-70 factor (ECF subfamily)
MRTCGEEPNPGATVAGPWHMIRALAARGNLGAARAPQAIGRPRAAAPRETAGLPRSYRMTDDAAMDAAGVTATDAELMARVAARDQQAFAQLYDRHVHAVYGTVMRYLRDPGAAEDVVQETWLAMWTRPDSYAAGSGSLIGWLLAIARNRAIDRLRAASRHPMIVGIAPGPQDGGESDAERLMALGRPVGSSAAVDLPPDLAERRWVLAVLRSAIDGMPAPERQAVELAYDDGLTQTEIAARLGLPLGTVKTRTRRGLMRLRAMLEGVPDIGPWTEGSLAIAAGQDTDGGRRGPR